MRISLLLIGAGLLLMVLASTWPQIRGVQPMWSNQQAAEYANSAASLHRLKHEASHAPKDPHVTESLEAAQRRFDVSTTALQAAKAGRATVVGILWWTGAALLLAGGSVFFAARGRAGAGR
jgi:hypothetical protein